MVFICPSVTICILKFISKTDVYYIIDTDLEVVHCVSFQKCNLPKTDCDFKILNLLYKLR